MSFEGDTGPYLMYSFARTNSILRKAKEQGHELSVENLELLTHETETDLMREIYEFNNVFFQSSENFRPSVLTHYLFSFCKIFNRFYTEVPVLKAESKEVISARLALVKAFAMTVQQGLHLLGITPPERM